MGNSEPSTRQTDATRPNVLAPAALLCVFAFALPLPMSARPASGISKAECLTLADGPRKSAPPVSLLEKCSALVPDDVELLADLGAAYEATDSRKAEAAYRRALDVDANFADLRLRLGSLLLRRGAAAEALTEAEAALRIQPNRQVLLDLRDAAFAAQQGTP